MHSKLHWENHIVSQNNCGLNRFPQVILHWQPCGKSVPQKWYYKFYHKLCILFGHFDSYQPLELDSQTAADIFWSHFVNWSNCTLGCHDISPSIFECCKKGRIQSQSLDSTVSSSRWDLLVNCIFFLKLCKYLSDWKQMKDSHWVRNTFPNYHSMSSSYRNFLFDTLCGTARKIWFQRLF